MRKESERSPKGSKDCCPRQHGILQAAVPQFNFSATTVLAKVHCSFRRGSRKKVKHSLCPKNTDMLPAAARGYHGKAFQLPFPVPSHKFGLLAPSELAGVLDAPQSRPTLNGLS